MKNPGILILIALLVMATAGFAAESGEPSVAIITGEVRNPTSREITFSYDPPSALGRNSEQRVVLDSRNRFTLEIPVVRGTLVRGSYKGRGVPWKPVRQAVAFLLKPGPLVCFVEPGDSLHISIHPGYLYTSYRFSGRNADNNRFIAEWYPGFQDFQKKIRDSREMEAEDFSRLADGWRANQLEVLDRRRTRYAFSPEFIEYAKRYFNYTYAYLMISYPTNYLFATGRENRNIPPEFYDFLKQVPQVDEKAIGVDPYHTFLVRTLDRDLMNMPRPPRRPSGAIGRPPRDRGEFEAPKQSRWPWLSEMYDLSGLGLSEKTLAQLDSLYETDGLRPKLSKMVDLSALGFFPAARARLDSMYEKKRRPKLSQRFDLAAFGLTQTAQAELDSLYEKSPSYRVTSSSKEKEPRVDTTGGVLVFYLPIVKKMDSLAREPRKLSEKIDLLGLELSKGLRTKLDSIYANRQPLRLSEKLDLPSMGLTQSVQAKLDSVYKIKRRTIYSSQTRRFDLASERLKGRVLYWFLAGELIRGFDYGGEGFAQVRRKWLDFQASNPYPEYDTAVKAALDRATALRPGRPAPDFTLSDQGGQQVSLSQFRGKVVLLDFWASWCGPCIGNLPYIRELKKKTTDLPVVFVNLSLDSSDAAWRKAIDKHGIKGVHVRSGVWGSGTTSAYNVRAIPAYFLVDPQGIIVERLSGVRDTDAVVAKILKSLGSV